MCATKDGRDQCERSGKCEFRLGKDADCTYTPTTTTQEIGCCYGDTESSNAMCAEKEGREQCERSAKCEFRAGEDADCELPTTTQEIGCCKGDSAKINEKCNARDTKTQCDRSSSCTWLSDVEDSECEYDETTTAEPGCCFGNPDAAYSKRWMDACTAFLTERDCLLLTNDDSEFRCAWEPLGAYGDCEQLWPTTTSTPVGCCYGDSYKANAKCTRATDRSRCEDMGCSFLETDDPTDCEMTTTKTPTTTVEPGCCYGDGVKENAMCATKDGLDQCERSGKCEFRAGEDADCELPTTTTETPEPGCCKGDTKAANERCVLMSTPADCERSTRCDWNHGEDADCTWVETTEPVVPGCCYGNPDLPYNSRWMAACINFGAEAECTKLTDSAGVQRCHWEIVRNDEFDCEQLWPTTTSTPSGCCYGDSYKANAKCLRATDRSRCEDMGCSFLETDDPTDCELTTTKTPTTTEEPGCCYGDGVKENAMCATKEGRDQCERSGKCEFRSGKDADCTYTPTTTTQEIGCCYGDTKQSNAMCAEKDGRELCERSAKCEFRAGEDADCELPTTTTETPEPGCCKGDTKAANERCVLNSTPADCERSTRCDWT